MRQPARVAIVAVLLALVGFGLFVFLGEGPALDVPGVGLADAASEDLDAAERPDPFAAEEEGEPDSGRTELGLAEDAFGGPTSRLVYRGRVLSRAGAPVAGADLRLSTGARGPGRPQQAQAAPVLKGKSGPDGLFAIAATAPRVSFWTILVQHAEFAPLRQGGLSPAVAGEVYLGDLVLGEGGLIQGRVVDEKEAGVAGAKVTVRGEEGPFRGRGGPGGPGGASDLEGPAVEALTAADGTFRLARVPRGELRLVAQHPDRPPGRSALVRLEDGTSVTGVKIVLEPGLRVTGIVSAEGKGPLPGARVSIPGQFGALGRGVLTDAKGAFALPPLAPGRYQLAAAAEGWQPAVAALALEAEKPPQALELTLKAGGVLAGQVVDPQGSPVTLFAVRVLPAEMAGLNGAPGAADAQGRPQGRGRFGQEGAQRVPGQERVRDAGFGRGQERQEGRARAGDANGAEAGDFLRRIQERMGGQGLPQDALQRIQERLGQAGLTPEAIQQMQQRFQGRAGAGDQLAQTAMEILGQLNNRARRPEEHPEGRFQVQGLPPARYLLEIRAPGHQTTRSEPLDLTAQGSITNLRIAVEPTLGIEGRVVARSSGKPVSGARVMALPAAREEGAPGGRRGPQGGGGPGMRGGFGAESDAQGRFRIEDLGPGAYTLRAFADGYGQGRAEGIEVARGKAAPQVEVPLPGPASLTGRVTGFSQAERHTVMVAAMGPSRRPELAGIGPDGSFEMTGLSPGPYFVRAFAGFSRETIGGLFRSTFQPGGQQPAPDITLEEDKASRIELALWRESQGTLIGTLTKQGAPAVGARIELERKREEASGERGGRELMDMAARMMGGPGGLSSEVDVLGGFKLSGLEPGTYTISATAQGRSRSSLGTAAVFADQVTRIDLLWGSGALSGSVREAAGPLANAQVRLRAQGAEGAAGGPAARLRGLGAGAQAATDTAGNFRIQDLDPGHYTVEVTRRGQGGPPQTLALGAVDIYADQEARIDLFWSVASLRVRVLSEDGKPVARATLFAMGAGGGGRRPQGMNRTDEQGEALLENLPPGTLRLFVMAQGYARGELEVALAAGAPAYAEVRLKAAEPGSENQGFPGGRRPGAEGGPGRPGGERGPGRQGRGQRGEGAGPGGNRG